MTHRKDYQNLSKLERLELDFRHTSILIHYSERLRDLPGFEKQMERLQAQLNEIQAQITKIEMQPPMPSSTSTDPLEEMDTRGTA